MSRLGDRATSLGWAREAAQLDPRQNFFFRELPEEVQLAWRPLLRPVRVTIGSRLCAVGQPIRHVYLPIDAVVALMNTLPDASTALLAIVGAEGLVGLPAVMSGEAESGDAVVQSEGWVLQLEAEQFKQAFESDERVRQLTLRFIQVLASQFGQAAVCNRHHNSERQLCTILLRMMDRKNQTGLQVTHDRLARLTGLRRETITYAAAKLQQKGVLSYRRGFVSVRDRSVLESAACSCYEVVERLYRRAYFEGKDVWGKRQDDPGGR